MFEYSVTGYSRLLDKDRNSRISNRARLGRYAAAFLLTLLSLAFARGFAQASAGFLDVDQAFQVSVRTLSATQASLRWQIADACYLYRHRFKIESASPGVKVTGVTFPRGEPKQDHLFGNVEIFKNAVEGKIRLSRNGTGRNKVSLSVTYQGCDAAGMCYLPEHKQLSLDLPALTEEDMENNQAFDNGFGFAAGEDDILAVMQRKPPWFVLPSFFGFGVLLAFTPCVFPMLPIVSGIIAGQGRKITQGRAFRLTLCYVMASALTYTVFGIMAGLLGNNLQAAMQNPWVISAFSLLFVGLALSMLGLYELQMPALLQSKLVNLSLKLRGGQYWGAGLMGVFSALIIGPCVTAPLAGALLYIGQTGDAILGGAALFCMGLGMGIPLLAAGTFAGKFLPKAGRWMAAVRTLFGIGLLAVAIWLLGRVLPAKAVVMLWLLLTSLPVFLLLRKRHWQLAGSLTLSYAILLWLGFSGRYTDEIPAAVCSVVEACEAGLRPSLPFKRIHDLHELEQELADAAKVNKTVMLDFYADWCTACVDMERTTFSHPSVKQALTGVAVLQVDVTGHSEADKAMLRHLGVIGPPAVVFFNPGRKSPNPKRITGYADADTFLQIFKAQSLAAGD